MVAKIHLQMKQELSSSLTLRDQVRLRDLVEGNVGGWLSVVLTGNRCGDYDGPNPDSLP